VASETTESLGLVSYHTRQLEQYGALEPVRTEPRRGATQHYYRLTDLGKHAIAIDKATTRRLASEVRAGV
jgi:DNA-binding PadR family transcriptional regulator